MGDIKAVLFDMDGLMIDTETFTKKYWKVAFKEFGIDVSEDFFLKVIGLKRNDGKKIMESGIDANFDCDEVRDVRDKFFWKYIEQEGTPIKEGLLELIDFLEVNNIPKAIASSSSRERIERLLEGTTLLQHFQTIVAGDEIINGKPHPDIFLKASEKLNVDPSNCLVLEDSNVGIKAAKAAGMSAIMIPDLLEPTQESKDTVLKECKSLLEVIDVIK